MTACCWAARGSAINGSKYRRGEANHVRSALAGIVRIGPFEVDGQRKLGRIRDAFRVRQRIVERHLLPVGPSLRVGDRVAARRQRLRTRLFDRQSAADVPDIVEDDGVARDVKRREPLELARHHNFSG